MPPRSEIDYCQDDDDDRKSRRKAPPFLSRSSSTLSQDVEICSESLQGARQRRNNNNLASFSLDTPRIQQQQQELLLLQQKQHENDIKQDRPKPLLHPTTSLPLLVLIDMFAVSLVVPLLFQYYQRAGITAAHDREILSSLFSTAQIAGGLCMGVLTDVGVLSRKHMLLLSFGGSAMSYALIVYGGFPALVLSRVLVGLVKQTMTVTTTILTKLTTTQTRAKHMGRLTASSTVAWIVGPSVGALLYKYVDHRAPALVACALFALNMILVLMLVEDDEYMEEYHMIDETEKNEQGKESSLNQSKDDSSVEETTTSTTTTTKSTTTNNGSSSSSSSNSKKGFAAMLKNVKSCFSSKVLASVVLTQLIVTWVTKATNYTQLGSFYEDMYGLEPHHRGYISSYQQLLQFIVQSALVDHVLHWTGGERKTISVLTALLALVVLCESSSQRSLPLFFLVLCPLRSLCFAMMNLSLSTLVTHVAPTQAIFSVLAALDVLQNVVSVSVPFYRTTLFRYLPPRTSSLLSSSTVHMQGDPDPVSWLWSSSLHWCIAAIVITYLLLLSNRKEWKENEMHQQAPDHNQKTIVKKGK